MSLHSAIYISTARAGLGEAEVDSIVASSQRYNGPRLLTGVLLQYAGHFVQALEGPQEALDEILGRIRADARHDRLTMLEHAPLQKRRFPSWTMRRLAVPPGDAPAVDAFLRAFADGRGTGDLPHLMLLLQALAHRH